MFSDTWKSAIRELWQSGDPWMKFCQEMADREPKPIGDLGQWAHLMGVATGEERYGRYYQKAVLRGLEAFNLVPDGPNNSREEGIFLGIMYEQLRPHIMLPDYWLARIRNWRDYMLARQSQIDSDENVGHYFALRIYCRILGEDPAKYPWIGVLREKIGRYCELAKGGEWIESSEYNLGTLQLLTIGAAAVGMDEFPEVKDLLREVGEQLLWHLTPDFKDSVQWGDVQNPHDLMLNQRVALMFMVAHVNRDPDLLAALDKLIAEKPLYPHYWMYLWRALWFCEGKISHSGPIVPTGTRTTAQGLTIIRDEKQLVQVHFPPTPEVDHAPKYFGDVRWYRDGEWVLDHPLGYQITAETANVGLMAGLGWMLIRGLGTNGKFGVTTSRRYHDGYYDPPPAFGEWSRSVGFDGSVLSISDQFSGSWPTRIDRYEKPDQEAINKPGRFLWEVRFHTPTEPKIVAFQEGVISWRTRRGTEMLLTSAAPHVRFEKHEVGVNIAADAPISETEREGWVIVLGSDAPEEDFLTTIRPAGVELPPEEPDDEEVGWPMVFEGRMKAEVFPDKVVFTIRN